jgi:hypothetical protein
MKMRFSTLTVLATATIILALTATKQAAAQTYTLTFTNLTTSATTTGSPLTQSGQRFSPPVFIAHNAAYTLFTPGSTASFDIQNIAESGNSAPLLGTVNALLGGNVFSIGQTSLSAPLVQGQSTTATITVDAAHPFLSFASMLGWTNDGFVGLNGFDLRTVSGTTTINLGGWDAGTEKNNERSGFLGAIGGGNARDPEGGVITTHPGIVGNVDAPAAWNWTGAPARLTITAAPEPGTFALMAMAVAPVAGLLRRRRAVK